MTAVAQPNPIDRAARFFAAAQLGAESREQLGVLLVEHLLREAASGKHTRADGSLAEIPLTAVLMLPEPAPPGVRSEHCGMVCIDMFGHHVVCVSVCSRDQ